MFGELVSVFLGVLKFYGDIKEFLKVRKQFSQEEWTKTGAKILSGIKNATTDDQRLALAKQLADHLDHLP